MEHFWDNGLMDLFRARLIEDERSAATIDKYMRDLAAFRSFAGQTPINKDLVMKYKQHLIESYAPASVNSMLAAVNRFFREMGWHDCQVKTLKIQRQAFRPKDRELTKAEYLRLLKAAKDLGKQRLYLLMQTVCATGIRISELRFITLGAAASGIATVSLKGKTRKVLIPKALCKQLTQYAKNHGIRSGAIFVSAKGNPLDRSNILHEMKSLCDVAKVAQQKVFPHNLRHLFACLYYKAEKDLSHLADILGHSSINTTRIYTCTSSDTQVLQIDKLGLVI